MLRNSPSPAAGLADGATSEDRASALALAALGWALEDARRAERLLDLTGLTADELRTGLGDPRVLGAVLDFLANHEPDLIACAEALETEPEALLHAARVLNS
ncbi:MAG: DUF3572 domain-containing protein [Erythrobacter sp.]|nr:DUF3572 domain-containing protein [Erythrobacter sp.]